MKRPQNKPPPPQISWRWYSIAVIIVPLISVLIHSATKSAAPNKPLPPPPKPPSPSQPRPPPPPGALFYAAESGDAMSLRKILSSAIDLDELNSDGYAALHLAAMNNHLTAATMLLASGANASRPDTMGYRPLHRAAQSGSLQLLDSLITTHGCHVDATAKNGQTALWIAADAGHTSAVANLREHGARVTNPQPARPSITPLHAAAKHGHVDAVKLLLARGAPVSELSTERYTALHFVCGVSSTPREDAISTAKLLLAHGATPLTTAVNDEQPASAAYKCQAVTPITGGATLDVPTPWGDASTHCRAQIAALLSGDATARGASTHARTQAA